MFANEILTPQNVLGEIMYKRAARTAFEAVCHSVENELKIANEEKLLIYLQGANAEKIREKVSVETVRKLSSAASLLNKYIGRALNVEKMMYERMSQLPPEEFEEILRSAFQEDEYILILIGAILGAFVGMGQAFYMLTI